MLEKVDGLKLFRYANNFLILHNHGEGRKPDLVRELKPLFTNECKKLSFTSEVMVNRAHRFLDHQIVFHKDDAYWSHAPRSDKGLLPYGSAHSKLVKHNIVPGCLKVAIEKFCYHMSVKVALGQIGRLTLVGYLKHFLLSVASSLLKKLK